MIRWSGSDPVGAFTRVKALRHKACPLNTHGRRLCVASSQGQKLLGGSLVGHAVEPIPPAAPALLMDRWIGYGKTEKMSGSVRSLHSAPIAARLSHGPVVAGTGCIQPLGTQTKITHVFHAHALFIDDEGFAIPFEIVDLVGEVFREFLVLVRTLDKSHCAGLSLQIAHKDRILMDHITAQLPGIGKGQGLLKLTRMPQCAGLPGDFANTCHIRIDVVVLVHPAGPSGAFVFTPQAVVAAHGRITPVHDHASIMALDDAHMRVTTEAVLHVLKAALGIIAPGAPGLHALVCHPLVVVGDPGCGVARTTPENYACIGLVKPHQDVGVVCHTPEFVPLGVVFQLGVIGPKTALALGPGGHHATRQVRIIRGPARLIGRAHLCVRQRPIKGREFIDDPVYGEPARARAVFAMNVGGLQCRVVHADPQVHVARKPGLALHSQTP